MHLASKCNIELVENKNKSKQVRKNSTISDPEVCNGSLNVDSGHLASTDRKGYTLGITASDTCPRASYRRHQVALKATSCLGQYLYPGAASQVPEGL